MKKHLFAFVCLVSFLVAGQVLAANHYVRQGASGNGTDWSNAYGNLPATLVRGDTYYIADGNYGGYTFDDANSGSTYITIKKATDFDHGTDEGWQSSHGDGQAFFSSGIDFESSNWVFDGATGGGSGNWGAVFGFKVAETSDAKAVIRIGYSGTANNITVKHVDIQGKGSVSTQGGSYSNDGLTVYGESNILLSNYWMHGIGRTPFFLSAKDIIIEHGWVQSFYGSTAVHSEVASIWGFAGSVGDTTFRYNLFTDSQSTGGIMWDNASNNNASLYFYGNVVYQPAGANWSQANGFLGGWTGGAGEEFRNFKAYNNSFIGVKYLPLSNFPHVFSGNEAHNNVFYNCESPTFAKFSTHNYNYFINSGDTHLEANGTSAVSGDPFVDYIKFDFRLKSPNAAGKLLPAPFNIDPLGNARGADGVWDRGAYEYDGGTCTSNWTCTAWSTCQNSSQSRTCTDSNNCGTPSGKPATNQSCVSVKTSDLNNDKKVDVTDLGILLSNWGKTTKPTSDINQDGRVDVADLGILLSNWG